jgi:8-oxo-dGTP pyrophosphatase MutT (NUDIX family)
MKFTHAGSVVFQQFGNQTSYLVISSSNGSDRVLPKGHIEPNETAENAALRELREEAGITGEIVAKLTEQHFKVLDEIIFVQYFLIRKLGNIEEKENRSIQWLDEKNALKVLSFEEARAVLKKAVEVIRSQKIVSFNIY